MYPHERSLVAKLKGKPFALIGVNSDKDKTRLKQRMKQENITWRSFWNGPAGTGGPISRAWGVRGWPTIYVLDHQGIIRYKNVRGSSMDQAIDTLLAKVDGTTGLAGSNTPAAPVSAFREFKDATGRFTIRAKFLEFRKGKAHLEKEDGEILKLTMDQLSLPDQKYIRALLKNRK